MLTENRFKNYPFFSSSFNEPLIHLANNVSQLIVRTSVYLQVITWRTDIISISPFLKAFEYKDQTESNRFVSVAF